MPTGMRVLQSPLFVAAEEDLVVRQSVEGDGDFLADAVCPIALQQRRQRAAERGGVDAHASAAAGDRIADSLVALGYIDPVASRHRLIDILPYEHQVSVVDAKQPAGGCIYDAPPTEHAHSGDSVRQAFLYIG